MKKIYKKPQVIIENFEISEFIAGNCANLVGFNIENCSVSIFGEETIFGASHCTNDVTIGGNENDQYCYHIPSDSTRYFGS